METSHTPKYSHCTYLEHLLQMPQLRRTIEKSIEALKGTSHLFDSIAFRGMSGALVASSVAVALNKTLMMVRKPDEKGHSSFRIEGDCGARSYIIIDDQISTGTTIAAIITAVEVFAPQAELIGTLLTLDGMEFRPAPGIFDKYRFAINAARTRLREEMKANPQLIMRDYLTKY